MQSEELKNKIIDFMENCEKFYGKKIEIKGAISTHKSFDRHFTTYSFSEFYIENIRCRTSGFRLMFNGQREYYEISVDMITDFVEISPNSYCFIEKYTENIIRKTEIEFL